MKNLTGKERLAKRQKMSKDEDGAELDGKKVKLNGDKEILVSSKQQHNGLSVQESIDLIKQVAAGATLASRKLASRGLRLKLRHAADITTPDALSELLTGLTSAGIIGGFIYFSKLPLELRRMIWKMAIPRRVAEIAMDHYYDDENHPDTYDMDHLEALNCEPHAILGESRSVVLERKKFHLVGDTSRIGQPGNELVLKWFPPYIDAELDTIFMPWMGDDRPDPDEIDDNFVWPEQMGLISGAGFTAAECAMMKSLAIDEDLLKVSLNEEYSDEDGNPKSSEHMGGHAFAAFSNLDELSIVVHAHYPRDAYEAHESYGYGRQFHMPAEWRAERGKSDMYLVPSKLKDKTEFVTLLQPFFDKVKEVNPKWNAPKEFNIKTVMRKGVICCPDELETEVGVSKDGDSKDGLGPDDA